MLFNKYELNELKKADNEINRTFKITRKEIDAANMRDREALGVPKMNEVRRAESETRKEYYRLRYLKQKEAKTKH